MTRWNRRVEVESRLEGLEVLCKDLICAVHEDRTHGHVDVGGQSLLLLQLKTPSQDSGSTGRNMLSTKITELHGLQLDNVCLGG